MSDEGVGGMGRWWGSGRTQSSKRELHTVQESFVTQSVLWFLLSSRLEFQFSQFTVTVTLALDEHRRTNS